MFRRRSPSDQDLDAAPLRVGLPARLRRLLPSRKPKRRRRPVVSLLPPVPPRRRMKWGLWTAALVGAVLGTVKGMWEWGFTGRDPGQARAVAELFLWLLAGAGVGVVVAILRNLVMFERHRLPFRRKPL